MSIIENGNINQILQSYFPNIFFNHVIINNETQIIIRITNIANQLCLELEINKTMPEVLVIKHIKKCDNENPDPEESMTGIGSGKYLLHCIELLAKDLHINKIIIDNDASVINIRCKDKSFVFSLKYLYLFSFGYTWYGKYGFKLKYQSDLFIESIHEFINQPFTDPTSRPFLTLRPSLSKNVNIKVNDYFQHMLKDIQKRTKENKCITRKDSIDLERYYTILQHYIQLWNQFISNKQINDDGPYIKMINGGTLNANNKTNKTKTNKTKTNTRKTNNRKTKRNIRNKSKPKLEQRGGEKTKIPGISSNIYWVTDSQYFDQITEPAINYNYIYIAIGAKDNNSMIRPIPGYGNKGSCELIPHFLEEYLLFEKERDIISNPKLLIVIIDEFNVESEKNNNIHILHNRCIELNKQNPLCKIDIYVINKLFDKSLSNEMLDYLNKPQPPLLPQQLPQPPPLLPEQALLQDPLLLPQQLPEPLPLLPQDPLLPQPQPLPQEPTKRQHTRDNLWICNYVHFYNPNSLDEKIEGDVSKLCIEIADANNGELQRNVYKWLGKYSPDLLCLQKKHDILVTFLFYKLPRSRITNKEKIDFVQKRTPLLSTINIINICYSNIIYDDANNNMYYEWDVDINNHHYEKIYSILFEPYYHFINQR